MTDYNDGKWHGWNGGECPVDPESLVELRWDDVSRGGYSKAGAWRDECWRHVSGAGRIVAFRVAKPAPPKPRTGYVHPHHVHETLEDFWAAYSPEQTPIHVREVLPE